MYCISSSSFEMNALFSVLAARHFDFDLTVVWMWLGCIKASSYSPTFHSSSRCRQWHWFLFRNFWIKYHLLVSNLSMGIRMRWKTVSDLDLSWILSQARNKKRAENLLHSRRERSLSRLSSSEIFPILLVSDWSVSRKLIFWLDNMRAIWGHKPAAAKCTISG